MPQHPCKRKEPGYSEAQQRLPGDHSAKPGPEDLVQGKSVPLHLSGKEPQSVKLSPGTVFYKFNHHITNVFEEV